MSDPVLHHRFRHYQGRWSNFDLVEPCRRPETCIGCLYHHPFCTETGRVLAGDELTIDGRRVELAR